MHILLIGATGRTGLLVLSELLSRGHTVTALVRDPSKLTPQPNLHIIKGSPLSPTSISSAFDLLPTSTPSAVIVTLSAPRASDSPFAKPLAPPRFMADSHANLVSAMQARGVRKIVTMSAAGVGSSRGSMSCVVNLVLRKTNMAAQFEDHDLVDAEMRARQGVEWVLVRPCMLVEGEARAVRVLGDEGRGVGMFDKVTRGSVAGFLVGAVEGGEWVGRSPVIAN